jgi:cytochrome P450
MCLSFPRIVMGNNQHIPPMAPHLNRWWGHYGMFKKNPLLFLLQNARTLGPVFRFKIFHKEYVVVHHPDAVRHVLVNQAKNYSRVKSYSFLQELLGQGLLTTEGEGWRKQRRLTQPIFSRDQLTQLIHQMDESILFFFEHEWHSEKKVDLEKTMNVLTLQLLTQSILYSPNQEHFGQVQFDLHDALVYMTSKRFNALNFLSFLPSMKKHKGRKAIERLQSLIRDIIANRRLSASSQHHDLLEMLMSTRDEETGEQLSDEALQDEVMTMFVAGHDTTAAALIWILYALECHTKIKQRMMEELDAGYQGQAITGELLQQMPYMKMVVLEAMRLFPPVWAFGRKSREADELMGFNIAQGQSVNVPIYCVHRHPDFWERPDEFYPEHFLPEAVKSRDKFAYMPFSLGQHRCIGEHFALMEIQMVLMRIFHHYDIQLKTAEPMEFLPLVTLKPLTSMELHVIPKQR